MINLFQNNEAFKIVPLKREGQSVTFLSLEELPLGQEIEVCDETGAIARVILSQTRQPEVGGRLCFGELLAGQLEPAETHSLSLRRVPRVALSIRVRSAELPGFSGITQDISERGLQLATEHALRVGSELELTLDLDDGGEPVTLLCGVRWTESHKIHRAGLCFLDASPQEARRLLAYLEARFAGHELPSGERERDLSGKSQGELEGAYLANAERKGNALYLHLVCDDRVVEYLFTDPVLSVSELTGNGLKVGRLERKPAELGDDLFQLYDTEGLLVLELSSATPRITERTIDIQSIA